MNFAPGDTIRVRDDWPERRSPAGADGWSEQRLAAIVREGDMIGVTVPIA